MKKIKLLLPVFLAAVMILSIPFAAACKKKKNKPTTELQSVSVNADGAKTEYYQGDEFSASGLVVTATLKHSDQENPEVKTLTAEDYTVDSSAYNKSKVGKYEIKVSYTFESVTKSAEYEVTVNSAYDGLEVKWIGNNDTYTLNMLRKSATIDVSQIEVREIESDGTVRTTPITDYDVELYLAGEKIQLTDGKATVRDGGAYQIWASKPSSRVEGYTLKGFVRVYVMNAISQLEVNSNSNTALFTQAAGRKDLMSPTWSYTLTYANGNTTQLTAADVKVSGVNSKLGVNAEDGGVRLATATYNSIDAKGAAVKTECSIPITVTGVYSPNTLLFNVNNYGAETIDANRYIHVATKGDGSAVTDNELGYIQILATSDDNGGMQITGSSNSLEASIPDLDLNFGMRLQTLGNSYVDRRSIKLELIGAAAVTVVASSNSATMERTMALFDSEFLPINEDFTVAKTGYYTFEISEAGTYYLGSMNSNMCLYYILVEYED